MTGKLTLDSDFKTTSAAGTARLATLLRSAINKSKSLETKSALIGVSTLAASMNGKYTSIEAMCKQFGVPDDGLELIRKEAKNAGVLDEKFKFSTNEFRKHVQYHYWETEEGVMITAQEEGWQDKLSVEHLGAKKNRRVRISTEGTLADERLRKGK